MNLQHPLFTAACKIDPISIGEALRKQVLNARKIQKVKSYQSINAIKKLSEIAEIERIYTDLREEARREIESITREIELVEKDLLTSVDIDEYDNSEAGIIEIRAGTGGSESSMFVKELSEMYSKSFQNLDVRLEYCEKQSHANESIHKFSGGNLFKLYRMEAGIHRIQRIPKTEKHGRLHTSTVSVAVIPFISRQNVLLDENDLKIESFRSNGPGGQSANMSNSAVRITHIPTGFCVLNQEERSHSVVPYFFDPRIRKRH